MPEIIDYFEHVKPPNEKIKYMLLVFHESLQHGIDVNYSFYPEDHGGVLVELPRFDRLAMSAIDRLVSTPHEKIQYVICYSRFVFDCFRAVIARGKLSSDEVCFRFIEDSFCPLEEDWSDIIWEDIRVDDYGCIDEKDLDRLFPEHYDIRSRFC